MDADVAYADCRLDAWASWVRGEFGGAWPTITQLGRFIEQGALGASQAGAPLSGMPEHILEVDAAVARLEELLRTVLLVYYLTYADSEVKADQCGCSRATFWRRVTRGQKVIAGILLRGETPYDNQAAEVELPLSFMVGVEPDPAPPPPAPPLINFAAFRRRKLALA
jgi:predicted DNA-binding protein (UPF0251 family)